MHASFHNIKVQKKREADFRKRLRAYVRKIGLPPKKFEYTNPESALFAPFDTVVHTKLKRSLKSFQGVRYVVLVGIGGSSLGTEAVYRALAYKTSPKLIVLDVIDIDAQKKLVELFSSEKKVRDIVCVVVSKSGSTTETMLNASKVLELGKTTYGASFLSQVIFIGDPDTKFLKAGKKEKVLCITMPVSIEGRYSVFTPVGLVPLMLLNIDVQSLCEGAQEACAKKQQVMTEDAAIHLASLALEGVHTVNFFTFNERLASLGLWYRQLLAESIGKQMTEKGRTFSHQLLPIVSTSEDLHSMVQLYLGGYKNIYTHFVHYSEAVSFKERSSSWLLAHIPFLNKKEFRVVQDAIKRGVITAYNDKKLPFRETTMEGCTAYDIGFFLASSMLEVMFLAHLFNVDAFNQPNVEDYKKHTRNLLF